MATAASAQDRGVVFTGAEGGDDSSTYAGVTWAAPGSRLGSGWAFRGLASIGRYDYRRGTGDVEAKFTQGDLALLRQSSGAWGYVNAGVGVRITSTDLSPNDPGNDREGDHWDGIVTADGARDLGDWRVGGYGVYGVGMREYYVRVEATRRLGSGALRAGAEVLADGDENYDRSGVGLVLAYTAAPGLDLRGAIGRRQGDAYVSVGLSRAF